MSGRGEADGIATLTRELLDMARSLSALHELHGFEEPLEPWRLRSYIADAIAERLSLRDQLRHVASTLEADGDSMWQGNASQTRGTVDGIDRNALRDALLRTLLDHAAAGGAWRTHFHIMRMACASLEPNAQRQRDRADAYRAQSRALLVDLQAEGLLEPRGRGLRITQQGKQWLAAQDARTVRGGA
jgi:hypothetical protein